MAYIVIWKMKEGNLISSNVDFVPEGADTRNRTEIHFRVLQGYLVEKINRHIDGEFLELASARLYDHTIKLGEKFSPELIRKLDEEGHTVSW